MHFNSEISIIAVIEFIMLFVILFWNWQQDKKIRNQLSLQNRQIELQNTQFKFSFFSEYTKRYQEIVVHFPENINENGFSYEKLDKQIRDKTLRYMRVYFDLCNEEFFLHKQGRLNKEVWREWEEGMTSAFQKTAFKKAWKYIIKDTGFYKEFKDFVELKLK